MDHHATLSPSMMPALSRCSCYKKGEGSEYSEIGTKEHKLLEQILQKKVIINNANNTLFPELTFESIDNVIWAAKEIQDICQNSANMEIEKKMYYFDQDFNIVTFGTADIICHDKLIDYKSGEIRDYFAQMAAYALMLMEEKGYSFITVYEVYGRKKQIKTYEIGYTEAKTLVDSIVNNVNNPNKKPTMCNYCSWCGMLISCPEVNKSIDTIAKNREDWSLKEYHSSKILEPAEMSKALKMATQLSKWCDSVVFHAKDMMMKGVQLPGWKLDKRSGKREIKDIVKAYEMTDIGNEFFNACNVSITKLEEIYAACNPDITKKAAKEKLNRLLTESQLIELGKEQILLKEV